MMSWLLGLLALVNPAAAWFFVGNSVDSTMIFHASFTSSVNADFAVGSPTATTTGSPSLSGGTVDVSAANTTVVWDALNNAPSNLGTIRLKFKFKDFNDYYELWWDGDYPIDFAGGQPMNGIFLYVNEYATRLIQLVTFDNTGNPFNPDDYFTWPNDTNFHEYEINYHFANSGTKEYYSFLDGVLVKHNVMNPGTVNKTSSSKLVIGMTSVDASLAQPHVVYDDIKIFNVMKHTSNYTP